MAPYLMFSSKLSYTEKKVNKQLSRNFNIIAMKQAYTCKYTSGHLIPNSLSQSTATHATHDRIRATSIFAGVSHPLFHYYL